MGADYYSEQILTRTDPPSASAGIVIIEGAIIDKNARLGADVVIRPFPAGTEIINENCVVQDGIVVIPKNCGHSIRAHISNPDRLSRGIRLIFLGDRLMMNKNQPAADR